MKTKVTSSIASVIAANNKPFAKKQLPFILIPLFVFFYALSGYSQIANRNPVKPESNGNHHFKAWLTTGNTGTKPSVNFIGTRDAQPLVFRVNNQKAGYIDFRDTIQNTAFGYQTLNNIEPKAGGIFLSAFGWGALSSNTSGFGNTAHGAGSLSSNTTGAINTGIGIAALASNTMGAFNTAIGSFSLSGNTEGGFNTATGDYALNGNSTGLLIPLMVPLLLFLSTQKDLRTQQPGGFTVE